MEMHNHPLSSLFEQLGLTNSGQEIDTFIKQHSSLASNVLLHNAAFWSASQASFLKQAKDDDADWAEIVDQLDVMLCYVHDRYPCYQLNF